MAPPTGRAGIFVMAGKLREDELATPKNGFEVVGGMVLRYILPGF